MELFSVIVRFFQGGGEFMLPIAVVLVIGGTGYLYGGLIGALVFRMLQELFSTITPQYWQFWIGLVLVVIVLVGRERLHRWARAVTGKKIIETGISTPAGVDIGTGWP